MHDTSLSNDTPKSKSGALRRYLDLLVEFQGRRVGLALFCMLLAGVLNSVGLFTLLPLLKLAGLDGAQQTGFVGWVNRVLQQAGLTASAEGILTVFLVVYVGHSLIVRWMNLINVDLEQTFTKQLEQHLYAAIVRADWMFFLTNRQSDLTFALTQNVQRVAAGTTCFLRLLASAVIVLVQIGVCVAISPFVSTVMLTFAAGLALLILQYDGRIRKSGQKMVGLNSMLYANVTQFLAGMKEAKSNCSEEMQIDAFADSSAAIRDTRRDYARVSENTTLAYRLGAVIAVSVFLYTAIEVFAVPMVETTLLVVIASRLFPRLQSVHTLWQQVMHMLPAFDSVMDLRRRSTDACELAPSQSEYQLPMHRSVQMNEISFSYPDGTEVLRNIDLEIPFGSTVAIVGPSGAGKSTLADILMGLCPSKAGQILVDECGLTATNLRAWRQQVGYVPQETFLLNDSLRANLLWANSSATEEELLEAIRLASADDFVAALPAGLNTVLGDRGVRLSGGERQRIALARALLRKPRLLILDEATSALDGATQHRIMESVRELHGKMTVVIIAHRLSSVRQADRVIVLEDGRIQESGTYESLMERQGGRFQDMLRMDAA